MTRIPFDYYLDECTVQDKYRELAEKYRNEARYWEDAHEEQKQKVEELEDENFKLRQKLEDYESYRKDEEIFQRINNITTSYALKFLKETGIQL